MKRVYRRLLFFISTVVFLALAPLVVLYAMGYRTLATTVDPVPVGVVFIESFPRRADITLNDRAADRTPRALSGIPAGNVRIKITKEGYEGWEKKVAVTPGLVTELRAIRLFLQNREAQNVGNGVSLFSLSPNRQLIAVYFNEGLLQFYDSDGQAVSNAITLRRKPLSLLWASDSSTVLLRNQDGSIDLVTATSTAPRRLAALQGVQQVVWDPRIPGRLICQTKAGAVRVFNVTTNASATLVTYAPVFATSDRQIYVATKEGLAVYNLQGGLVRNIPLTLEQPVRQLLVTPAGRVGLVLENGKTFLLRDDKLVEVSSTATSVTWSPDGQMLLVQGDSSTLYVYNEADERSTLPLRKLHLITRLSRPIANSEWFAGGQHVLYQVDDEIRITEIDTRDFPVTVTVDTTNMGDADAAVGEDGEWMLYLKRADNETRLVRTQLVEEE